MMKAVKIKDTVVVFGEGAELDSALAAQAINVETLPEAPNDGAEYKLDIVDGKLTYTEVNKPIGQAEMVDMLVDLDYRLTLMEMGNAE